MDRTFGKSIDELRGAQLAITSTRLPSSLRIEGAVLAKTRRRMPDAKYEQGKTYVPIARLPFCTSTLVLLFGNIAVVALPSWTGC